MTSFDRQLPPPIYGGNEEAEMWREQLASDAAEAAHILWIVSGDFHPGRLEIRRDMQLETESGPFYLLAQSIDAIERIEDISRSKAEAELVTVSRVQNTSSENYIQRVEIRTGERFVASGPKAAWDMLEAIRWSPVD